MNETKKVAVIMGSDSDLPIVKKAVDKLKDFGVYVDVHIMSAHRSPDVLADFAKNAVASGFGVIIAAAGMAAHLAGVVAAHTVLPVIGLPIKSTLDGLDALLSTVQMPPGVPVATVGINAAENAAILAAQILAVDGDLALKEQLLQMKVAMNAKIAEKDRTLKLQ